MIFAAFILTVALAISGIAAFYSIIGLIAIFAAAAVPVIVMGGALETGKIVATVWLHQNWKRMPVAFKLYLIPAIAILMFVTSMGIFGFLSKAHIEQTAMSDEQRAEVTQLASKIIRSEAKIARWNTELGRLSKGEDQRVDNLVDRNQDTLNEVRGQITQEKANARTDAEKQIALQQKRLEQALDRKDADIKAAQVRKTADIAAAQARYQNSFNKKGLDDAIKEAQTTELATTETAKRNELSVASAAQREIKNINTTLNTRLNTIDQKYADGLASTNARIQNLRNAATTKTDDIDGKIDEFENLVDSEQLEIDKLNEEIAVYEKEYRKLEAEVGPIKYVAAVIYGDNPDVNMLERAVRWVILLLVVVFDPLALTLILAATKQFQWAREEKQSPTHAHREYTKEDDDLMNEMYPPNIEPEVKIERVYVEANVDTSMPADVADLEGNVNDKLRKKNNG